MIYIVYIYIGHLVRIKYINHTHITFTKENDYAFTNATLMRKLNYIH